MSKITLDELVEYTVDKWKDVADRPNTRERYYLRDDQRAAFVKPDEPDGFKWAVFNPGEDFTWLFGTTETMEVAAAKADEELKRILARYLDQRALALRKVFRLAKTS